MTVKELYNYASRNNLLDVDILDLDINDIINKFKNSLNSTTQKTLLLPFDLNKIEWSIEDVLELFSR